MQRYEGKKVVIIGGTSGMGLTTAKMLLDGGARVMVTGRLTTFTTGAELPVDGGWSQIEASMTRIPVAPLRRYRRQWRRLSRRH